MDVLDLPYVWPSRVPLLSIWELKERGLWVAPPTERDRGLVTVMTDNEIARMIAWQRPDTDAGA